MMVERRRVVEEARSWIGTPYRHQARLRSVGVDCAGLIMGVGNALGLTDLHYSDYGILPHKGMLRGICDKHFTPVHELEDGAILLMGFVQGPAQEQHLAIYSGLDTIIHSYLNVGRCIEHRYSSVWRSRTRAIYRYPGVV